MVLSLACDVSELEKLCELPTERALLREAVPFLARLVRDPAFVATEILSHLEEAKNTGAWYVVRRYDDVNGAYSLQVFVWPPGTGTRVHDHSSWGAFRCATGTVLEERYERLDGGARLNHAHLRKVWQLPWSRGKGSSTMLPYDLGIHRVSNPSKETAISVHLYGPRIGEVDGRDYDPTCNYVCNRRRD
jgi:predicted metal-dependent enzyme (double-stranded beta helix superfamily)